MNKEFELDDLIEIISEKLNSGGTVTFTPRGKSMLPMLRDGEDVVVLTKPKGRLRIFDVPLYRRSNGQYALHRVIDFDANGGYAMCGDNQFVLEHGIMDRDIIGVVTTFYRKGKTYRVTSLKYKAYVRFWHYTRYARRAYKFGQNRVLRFLGKGNNNKSNEKTTD
ncbi:MAG: S24/S26 family peptidase [Ruminococcus sp.]|nr:S24/S26 family peptidase [Ruminococcus sp.]